MRILLLGATGFIGSELTRALTVGGHHVVGFGRDPALAACRLPGIEWRNGDLRLLKSTADWLPLLHEIDVVVNASGTLQTGLRDNVNQVQSAAICTLVDACVTRNVSHFVQLSACNADIGSTSDFLASKAQADTFLAASGLSYTILRPGLVIGRNAFGGSEMLRMAASLPWVGLHPSGTGSIQCTAMSDVVDAVLRSIAAPQTSLGSFDLVEPGGHKLGEIIQLHRRWMGFATAHMDVTIPIWLMKPASLVADAFGWLGWRSPLRSTAIAALVQGVSGCAEHGQMLLGRPPLSLTETLAALPPPGKADRWQARCALVFPLALISLLLLWSVSGMLGLMRPGIAQSYLLSSGMPPGLAAMLVAAGSAADILLAAGLLLRATARSSLQGTLMLSGAYLAASLCVRPDLWLDPLAPLLKILPIIAVTLLCLAMLDER